MEGKNKISCTSLKLHICRTNWKSFSSTGIFFSSTGNWSTGKFITLLLWKVLTNWFALVINGNWCPGGMLHLLLSNDPFHPLGMYWPFFEEATALTYSTSTNCNVYLLLNQWPWARIRIRAFTKVAVSAHYTIHSVLAIYLSWLGIFWHSCV